MVDENTRFAVFMGCSKRFEATIVFHDFRLFGGMEHSVKRLLLRFGNFCAYDNNDNDDRTDYFTPCACVWGNYYCNKWVCCESMYIFTWSSCIFQCQFYLSICCLSVCMYYVCMYVGIKIAKSISRVSYTCMCDHICRERWKSRYKTMFWITTNQVPANLVTIVCFLPTLIVLAPTWYLCMHTDNRLCDNII